MLNCFEEAMTRIHKNPNMLHTLNYHSDTPQQSDMIVQERRNSSALAMELH